MNLEFEKIWPWIRGCAYDAGYTKDNVFVGKEMFIENVTASFAAALSVMIDKGLLRELEKEAQKRIQNGESGGEVIQGETEIIPFRNFTLSPVHPVAKIAGAAAIPVTPQAAAATVPPVKKKASKHQTWSSLVKTTIEPKPAPGAVTSSVTVKSTNDSGISAPPSKNTGSSSQLYREPPPVQRFDFSEVTLDLPAVVSEVPTHTFYFQHQVLTSTQSILEATCYKFSEKQYPSILTRNKWRCPEAGELTAWTKEMIRAYEADPEPVNRAVYSPARFPKMLKELAELRHTTVHRLHVSREKLQGLVGHAFSVVKMLKDDKAIHKVSLLYYGLGHCESLASTALAFKDSNMIDLLHELNDLKSELERLETQVKAFEKSRGGIVGWNEQVNRTYEEFLEGQLEWMCKGSAKKSLETISSEWETQLEAIYYVTGDGDELETQQVIEIDDTCSW